MMQCLLICPFRLLVGYKFEFNHLKNMDITAFSQYCALFVNTKSNKAEVSFQKILGSIHAHIENITNAFIGQY